MSLDLINNDFLSQVDVKELANICYFSDSNKYIDYCSDNKGFEFRFSSPIRAEFLNTLNDQDKKALIEIILSSPKAIQKAYEWLFDCDADIQEVA